MNGISLPPQAADVLLRDAIERDMTAARRAALVTLLLHERHLTREQLIARVEGALGRGCFGTAAWVDTFYRDMRVVKSALSAAGYRLGYSRSTDHPGYFLHGQPGISTHLAETLRHSAAEVDPAQINIFRNMPPAARFRLGCSVTDSARSAAAHRLRQRRPELSLAEAGRLVLQGGRQP
jgi:hypothetical protein